MRGHFVKFDKIWVFLDFSGRPEIIPGKGPANGFVQWLGTQLAIERVMSVVNQHLSNRAEPQCLQLYLAHSSEGVSGPVQPRSHTPPVIPTRSRACLASWRDQSFAVL